MTRLGNTNFSIFIQCQYLTTILRNKNKEQSLLRNIQNFKVLMKYFTMALTYSATRIWTLLCHVITQKLF